MTPRLPAGVRRLFRLPVPARRIDGEVRDEVDFHLQMTVEDLVARGLSRNEAEAEAHRRFGDVDRWRRTLGEEDRRRADDSRRAEWWDALRQDAAYALRGLRRQPGFALAAVLTLALGTGANATMFGIVDRLMLRPPAHVVDAERVRRVYFTMNDGGFASGVQDRGNWPQVVHLREQVKAFERIGVAFRTDMVYGEAPNARQIQATVVDHEFLRLLGVRPRLGRFFTAEEDRPPVGTAVAVLGYDFWQTSFGGDPGVLGRTVRVGGDQYQVIGVAPPGFSGIDLRRVDVWLPVSVAANSIGGSDWHTMRDMIWLQVVGRMRPGATDAELDAQLALAYPRWIASRPGTTGAELARLKPASYAGPIQRDRGPARSEDAKVATWLAGVSLIVLLIACANVANLLLARAMRRRRELAVRLALGAGRGRLAAQLLTEAVLLALLGAGAGLLVARWGGGRVRATLLPEVAWPETLTDGRVLAFTLASAVAAGLLAGVVPALQASRPRLTAALAGGQRGGGLQRSRARTTLLVTQAALSAVLLIGAGLFVRSLRNVTSADLGYDQRKVFMVELDTRGSGYTSAEESELQKRLHERLRTIPGVESVSRSGTAPFYSGAMRGISVPGLDSIPTLPTGRPWFNPVTPEYFRTMGTSIVRGRGFTPDDRRGAEPVLIVNETMARLLWPGQDALGKCVKIGDASSPCSTVVGVAEEARWNEIRPEPVMQFYAPMEQQPSRGLGTIFVRPAARTNAEFVAVGERVRRAALAESPKLGFVTIRPLADLVEPSIRPWRLGATLFGAFGLLALVVTTVGLYGVLAYAVAQRTHEMGVRLALGARAADVLRLVVGEGLRLVAAGVALGSAVALYGGRWIESLLYGVSARDPLTVGVVGLTLLAVAVAASWVPAWRATRVDPNVALRAE